MNNDTREVINAEFCDLVASGKHARLRGDISSGLSGDISGLRGDISGLRGDISGLRGDISSGLRGDISGLRGDISGLSGDISSGLSGDISENEQLFKDITEGKYPGLSLYIPSAEEVARLDAVREIVMKQPKRLKMDGWHFGEWTPEHTPEEEHACGSAHCIAGWIQALCPDQSKRQDDTRKVASELCPIASGMFFVDDATAYKWLEARQYAKRVAPIANVIPENQS